jgi:hypothetical protein
MTQTDRQFLAIISEGLHGKTYEGQIRAADVLDLLRIADEHYLLPFVAQAIYNNPDFPKDTTRQAQGRAISQSTRQIVQTNEFLTLLLDAQAQGLDPIVLKGVTVRSLYPAPYLRPSVDEDILVTRGEAPAFHRFLLFQGLTADDPDGDPETDAELSYHKPDSPTYVEMHICYFDIDSAAYGGMNNLFKGAESRAVTQQIEDVSVRTLEPTDHLLYLLCHVYKHFLHSGAGIRQVADIGMFAKAHDEEIDWERVESSCKEVHIDIFAAAIFKIIKKYLLPELGKGASTAFSSIRTDEGPLLEDMLSGGIYGLSDPDRVHSANMTLTAAEASREGKGTGHGVLRSLFPSATYLKNCFPYAKKHPILLPVAWAHRLYRYMKRTSGALRSSMRTIRAGKKRIAMMKKYGIVE